VGSIKYWRILVVILGVVLLAAVLSSAAEAAEGPRQDERHCVVEVVAVEGGELVTGEEVCFGSRAEAVRQASDASGWGSAALAARSTTIGVHYTSRSYGGSSITIVGTTCSGGVWRPSGSWNNNIESSRHYCGGSATRFYDSSTCSGTSKAIYSQTTSLTWMNNRTSCVRYG
jgi:hypothetical protein